MSLDPTKTLASVKKLTGKETWADWKSDIELTLGLNQTWRYVNGTDPVPSDATELKGLQPRLDVALYCLKFTCDSANRLLVADKEDAVAVYSTLRQTYEGDTPAKRMSLRRRLYHLTHDRSEPVTSFIGTIRSITTELASIGHPLKPDEIRDVVLMNLDSSFDTIGTILASSDKNDGKEWTLDALSIRLADWEEAHNDKIGSSSLQVANFAGRHARRHQNHQNHSRSPSNENWFNKFGVPGACGRCGQLRHTADNCFRDMPEYAKQQALHRRHPSETVNSASSTRTLLSIPAIISSARNGVSYIFNRDSGSVWDGNDVIGSLDYEGKNVYSDISASAALTANVSYYPGYGGVSDIAC